MWYYISRTFILKPPSCSPPISDGFIHCYLYRRPRQIRGRWCADPSSCRGTQPVERRWDLRDRLSYARFHICVFGKLNREFSADHCRSGISHSSLSVQAIYLYCMSSRPCLFYRPFCIRQMRRRPAGGMAEGVGSVEWRRLELTVF